ncbi:sulfur carrier protein ThiS [Neobacillus mesonae]|uniref:Thiamine biosynthesis protein ThiS n=1 Tax=Neobacillus mesonae TaxID=1193713 RepID=A0A3Q9QXP4_9BACI|nr:sulfur carrier protein ThiS [Neobacillus mesonae]AZU62752.1 thiamine biosynthesis protein ThiS [Neobacillus mesonae]MED4205832.1 sulfur carrier protein ThiS [Neobacillus mesonae]
MTIQLNGRTVELPEDVKNVDTLLKHYNLENRIVIVELNNEIADKSKYTELPIADGDKVEMIHFVGGG